jgi:hypothetical protein
MLVVWGIRVGLVAEPKAETGKSCVFQPECSQITGCIIRVLVSDQIRDNTTCGLERFMRIRHRLGCARVPHVVINGCVTGDRIATRDGVGHANTVHAVIATSMCAMNDSLDCRQYTDSRVMHLRAAPALANGPYMDVDLADR